MRRLALPALLLLTLAAPTAASAGGHPLSLSTYRQRIHALRLGLDRAVSGRPYDRAAARRVRLGLLQMGRVRLPGGRVAVTDSPTLGRTLDPTSETSARQVASELDGLDKALSGNRVSAISHANLASLDTVLRDPRFHPFVPPWIRFRDWLEDQLVRLLFRFYQLLNGGGAGVGGFFTRLAFALVFLAIAGGIAYLIARGALKRVTVTVREEEDRDRPVTSAAAQGRVAEQIAAGDYRNALRYLFLATMLSLQEQGLLRLQPGLTNRDYLGLLRSHVGADLSNDRWSALEGLVDGFDRVWYGHQPLDAAGFQGYRSLADRASGASSRQAA